MEAIEKESLFTEKIELMVSKQRKGKDEDWKKKSPRKKAL